MNTETRNTLCFAFAAVVCTALAIAFNTGVERGFLRSRFDLRAKSEEVVGCGVDLDCGLISSIDFQLQLALRVSL